MPTPQQFLEQVVAWPGPGGPGYVNLHWKKPGGKPGMPGRPFKEVHDFMQFAWQATPKSGIYNDLYFCLSTQKQTGKVFHGTVTAARGAHLADRLKAIWLDVDGNKPSEKGYGSKLEAYTAIAQFISDAQLPAPSAIVDSGNGFHVYWIAEQAMTVDEWTPYATGLWALVKKHGFRCDNVTTDCARVLRVPGTFNRKDPANPKTVKLMGKGEDPMPANYDFPRDLAHVALLGTAPKTVTAAVTAAGAPAAPLFDMRAFQGYAVPAALAHLNPQADLLSSGIGMANDDRPLRRGQLFRECEHFKDCAQTQGAHHGQGLWALTLLACTFLEDGDQLAHIVSSGYRTYDPAETQAKYEEKVAYKAQRDLGWPSCQSFEDQGAACKKCPLRGKIGSPLKLAERPPMEVPAQPVPLAPEELHLPDGFTVDPQTHRICCVIDRQTPAGETLPTEYVPLFHHEITTPWVDSGGLHFRYHTGIEIRNITVSDEAMGSDQLLFIRLAKQLCHVWVPGQKYVRHFMTSWVSQIEKAKKRHTTHAMGWIEEEGQIIGFAYGGKMYMETGEINPASDPDKGIAADYTPAGVDKYTREAFDIIASRHHPALEVIALSGFASPLVKITTGEDFAVLWAMSPEGGAGKSTSILAGASVWGSPRRSKDNVSSSIAGLQSNMGNLRHLPKYIDEIMHEEQVDELIAELNLMTEGTSGSKALRDGSQRTKKEWQLQMTCGSNQSIQRRMLEKVKSTDALLRRIFEIEVEKRLGQHHDIRADVIDKLNANFGAIGALYAQHLGRNHKQILARGREIIADFTARIAPYKEENRFWRTTCVTTLAAVEQANLVLGKEVFHYNEIMDYLVAEYKKNDAFVAQKFSMPNSKDAADAMLAEFLKANIDTQVWTWDRPTGAGNKTLSSIKLPPDRNNPIHIHWYVIDRAVRISVTAFLRWIDISKKQGGSAAMENIAKQYGGVFMKCNLAAGLGLKGQSAEQCVEIKGISVNDVLHDALMEPVGAQTPPSHLTGNYVPTGIGPTGPTGTSPQTPP